MGIITLGYEDLVSLSMASAMTGHTVKSMESLIKRGSWREGEVFRKSVTGQIGISIPGYEDWVRGKFPAPQPAAPKAPILDRARPTKLYRHYDAAGELLYIGISLRAAYRLRQHMVSSHWADRIARITVEQHPDRPAAEQAETLAIEREKPLFNIAKVKKP